MIQLFYFLYNENLSFIKFHIFYNNVFFFFCLVPRLDLDSLESGYHGLVKENESLVEVTPQIRALGAKICSFHIANKHHGEAPFEILLKENGIAKLKALRVLNCEKRRNYKFDIAAVACNGAQSERYERALIRKMGIISKYYFF